MYFRKECFVLSLLMLCIPAVVYAGDADQDQDQAQVSDVAGGSNASCHLDSEKKGGDNWAGCDDLCDAGCFEPTVENYNSIIVNALGLDLLLYGGGHSDALTGKARLPVYTFDFPNLFRFNVHYLRAVRIAGSRFAFCFGSGYRTVLYAFPRFEGGNGVCQRLGLKGSCIQRAVPCMDSGRLDILGGDDSKANADSLGSMNAGRDGFACSVRRSVLALEYLDFLLRLRFNTNLEFPKSGFFTWVGLKFGYLLNARSLIKYEKNGLNSRPSVSSLVRCGAFGGINNKVSCLGELGFGYARIGLGVSFNVIPLFRSPWSGGCDPDLISRYSLSVGLAVDLV